MKISFNERECLVNSPHWEMPERAAYFMLGYAPHAKPYPGKSVSANPYVTGADVERMSLKNRN
jgi:hypothetical protein